MKTKLGYAASAFVCILLCAVMLCGAVLPTVADGEALPSLDYSNPNIESTVSLSAYDLYTVLLKSTPTAGEMLYWQTSGLALQYTDLIPDSCIDTHYDGDRGVLDVTLLPYTYHAANGAEVTWVPKKLYLEGKGYEVIPGDGIYTAHVENCVYSGDFDMKVDYVCEIQIPREVVYALRHDAYQKGYDAHLLMEDYRQKLSVYEALVEMQNKWNAYEKWEEDYANYLVEKEIYDALKKEYDAYMVEYNKYQAVVDAHNQWQTYFAEQEAYPAKQQAYAAYKNYEKDYNAAVAKLAMFESVFKKESRGWCMYNDIMGKTVTQVLANQNLLIAGGCNAADIHLAGDATENLRVLLKGYADLRNKKWKSDHEKYKALYTYYTQNYDALRQNFCDLYKTLKGLYENPSVSDYIGTKDKTLHYRQLVGHLFVVSTAFDQYSERNENVWRIDDKKLREVIEDVHYFADGDWDPVNTPFPATAVAYAEAPSVPVEPTVELPAFVPKAPTPVEDPGEAPTVVENPANTPRPEPPKPIGDKPQVPALDAITDLLCREVENGTLKKHEQYVYSEKLTLTTKVEREISIQNFKTVTLYRPDGTVYQKILVDYGKGIELEPYSFEESPAYTYEWLRWIRLLPNGEILDADVSCVTENISLYPRYIATPKVYYITWIVDGVSNTVPYYYGATPDPYDFISQFPYETQYNRYEFSGWTPEIAPVTGNATYEGWTVSSPKKFNITWVIKNGAERITEAWEYDQVPEFVGDPSYVDSHYRYTFVGWDKTVSRVTRAVTYTAVYTKEPLATGGVNTVLEVLQSEAEVTVLSTQNAVKLRQAAILAEETGKALTVSWQGKLSLSLSGEELKAYIAAGCPTLTLYARQNGDTTVYQFEFAAPIGGATVLPTFSIAFETAEESDRTAIFEVQTENGWERLPDATYTANGAFAVRKMYAYSIIPTANKLCNVMQLASQAVAGDWISLDLNCVYGYKVVGAKVTDENGNEIAVTELAFQMPASAVHIVLEVERIVYRVTFLVNGEVWSYAEYFAGDEIILPEDPPKRIEGEFTYTFTGWGNVPVIVTGDDEDLVFEAAFTQSQIIDDYDTGHNNNVLFTVVLPIAGGVLTLLIAFLITRRIIRKKGGWRVVKARMVAKRAQKHPK